MTVNALEKAKVDERHVIQLEWFTYPVSSPMASRIGVVHSVLAVAVGDKTTLHKYVLEKAQSSGTSQDGGKGVYVSDFDIVVSKLRESPVHTLTTNQLKEER